jgi:hypothetical protein
MKIDVRIKAVSTRAKNVFELCPNQKGHDEMIVACDLDYVDDYDDVIKYVEGELSEMCSISLYNVGDFVILNETDICEELYYNNEE